MTRMAIQQHNMRVQYLLTNAGPRGKAGKSFTVDSTGALSDRSLYDSEPVGYAFLDTENSSLYIREGVGWSAPIPFGKGEKGDNGPPGASGSQVFVVSNIVARDALSPSIGTMSYVLDTSSEYGPTGSSTLFLWIGASWVPIGKTGNDTQSWNTFTLSDGGNLITSDGLTFLVRN